MLGNTLGNAVERNRQLLALAQGGQKGWLVRGDERHRVAKSHRDLPNNKGNLSRDGLLNTGGSERGADNDRSVAGNSNVWGYQILVRDEDGRGSSTGFLHGIGDVGENGEVEVSSAGLLGVGTTDDVGACYMGELMFFFSRSRRKDKYRRRWPARRGNWGRNEACQYLAH